MQRTLPFEGEYFTQELDTQEKFIALSDSPTAGFLPFSNRETSQAFEMLDYLENRAKYPAGVGNRLQEIFLRQRNALNGGIAVAVRTLQSLAYEYGDYALNALEQLGAMDVLLAELKDGHFNPGVKVSEDEFESGANGLIAVVRFKDVQEVLKSGRSSTVFDPLKTVEHRKIDPNDTTKEKHKTVGDLYTSFGETDDAVLLRIERFMDETTIAQLRPLAHAARDNEFHRYNFWRYVVESTRAHGAAWTVGKTILGQLTAGSN